MSVVMVHPIACLPGSLSALTVWIINLMSHEKTGTPTIVSRPYALTRIIQAKGTKYSSTLNSHVFRLFLYKLHKPKPLRGFYITLP